MTDLGHHIYIRMKELGLTQVELARKSGLTQQAISQYIRGISLPRTDAIDKLMEGLEVGSAWFFDEDTAKAWLAEVKLPEPVSREAMREARGTLRERIGTLEAENALLRERIEQLEGLVLPKDASDSEDSEAASNEQDCEDKEV